MSKLTELMDYTLAGNTKRTRILNSYSFTNNYPNLKSLLLSEGMDSDELLRTEVISAINAGAENRRVMRNVLPIIPTNSKRVRPIYGTKPSGNLAYQIAEGAAYPTKTQYYSSGSGVDIKKYGLKSSITTELIEDAEFGIIEYELRKVGEAIENKLNEVAIGALLENHNGTTPADEDPAGSILQTVDLSDSYEKLNTLGWTAKDLILRPRSYGQIISGAQLNFNGNDCFGLSLHVLDTPYAGTKYWDDADASSHYYGLLLDSDNYGFIAMKNDITVNSLKDPIHDLVNFIVDIRFGVGVTHNDAAVRILTK